MTNNLDVSDIINELKKYRKTTQQQDFFNKKKNNGSKTNNRASSIPKGYPPVSKVYSTNRSFIIPNQIIPKKPNPLAGNSIEGMLGKNPVRKTCSDPFAYSVYKGAPRYTSTHPRKAINEFAPQLIQPSKVYKTKVVNNLYLTPSNERSYYSSTLARKMKVNSAFVFREGEQAEVNEEMSQNVGVHPKVKSDFISLQGDSSILSMPILAQITTLLDNQEKLTIEDIHFCFVTFHQRKKTMLKEIEEKTNKKNKDEKNIISINSKDDIDSSQH